MDVNTSDSSRYICVYLQYKTEHTQQISYYLIPSEITSALLVISDFLVLFVYGTLSVVCIYNNSHI